MTTVTVSFAAVGSGYSYHNDVIPWASDIVYFYNQPTTISITYDNAYGTPTSRPVFSVDGGYLGQSAAAYGYQCITFDPSFCDGGDPGVQVFNTLTGFLSGPWGDPQYSAYFGGGSWGISTYNANYNYSQTEWGTYIQSVPIPSSLLLLITGLVVLLGWRKRA